MDVRAGYAYYPSLCYWGLKQVGFAGDPEVRHEDWATELSRLGGDFSFAPPLAGGPMFSLMYQVPSYLDPKDPEELPVICSALQQFIHREEIDAFLREWPERTAHWERWFTAPWKTHILEGVGGDRDAACALVERFFEYLGFLWPRYEGIFSEHKDEDLISERIEVMDPRTAVRWGELLGVDYPYDAFEFIICPESPSLASSVGPEKVVIGQKHPPGVLKHAFVHEVGVRTVGLHRLSEHPATADLMMADYLAMVTLIEAEVCYHKPAVLPDLAEDVFLRGMGLEALVEHRRERKGPGRGESLPEFFARWHRDARRDGLL